HSSRWDQPQGRLRRDNCITPHLMRHIGKIGILDARLPESGWPTTCRNNYWQPHSGWEFGCGLSIELPLGTLSLDLGVSRDGGGGKSGAGEPARQGSPKKVRPEPNIQAP